MHSISVFLDIAKFTNSSENADVSKTQGLCHMSQIYFGSSLGKV